MIQGATQLRLGAEAAATGLPELILAAERLAATVQPGLHGRRRAGPGEDFWQYRPAHPGDTMRAIDWRRSARSDGQYVRDREWQAAQSMLLWVGDGRSMDYSGAPARPAKGERARVIGLALAMLALRGGERVGLLGQPARPGRIQTDRIAEGLAVPYAATEATAPDPTTLRPHQRVVLISDFLGDPQPVLDCLDHAGRLNVSGALLQITDPDEDSFPFSGAVTFRSVSGAARHDTRDAGGLRAAYLARLAERRDLLDRAARRSGWHFGLHDTGLAPAAALMWLYSVLGKRC